jgi:hypothetical protein
MKIKYNKIKVIGYRIKAIDNRIKAINNRIKAIDNRINTITPENRVSVINPNQILYYLR